MRLGMIEIEWAFIFQLLNTLLLLAVVIGIPYYIIRKLNRIEKHVQSIEKKIDRTGE